MEEDGWIEEEKRIMDIYRKRVSHVGDS